MPVGTKRDLAEKIVAYWDERASTYSNGVMDELADNRRGIWTAAIKDNSQEAFLSAMAHGRLAHAIDLGCGPGFFTSLLVREGCDVAAVDASSHMLTQARHNVLREASHANASFVQADLLSLPFDDGRFDLAVSRNVMWLMQDPAVAYVEWLRVLRPGGVLLVFDANWYRYLVDEMLNLTRHSDQDGNDIDEWQEDARATPDQERRCEIIASRLPLTSILRPAWDLHTLKKLGVKSSSADTSIWRQVWTPSEQAFYRTSPLFLVKAVK